jgi:hypothetical protein
VRHTCIALWGLFIQRVILQLNVAHLLLSLCSLHSACPPTIILTCSLGKTGSKATTLLYEYTSLVWFHASAMVYMRSSLFWVLHRVDWWLASDVSVQLISLIAVLIRRLSNLWRWRRVTLHLPPPPPMDVQYEWFRATKTPPSMHLEFLLHLRCS